MLKSFTHLGLFCPWIWRKEVILDPSSVNGQTCSTGSLLKPPTVPPTPNYQLSIGWKTEGFIQSQRKKCSPLLSPWLFLYSFLYLTVEILFLSFLDSSFTVPCSVLGCLHFLPSLRSKGGVFCWSFTPSPRSPSMFCDVILSRGRVTFHPWNVRSLGGKRPLVRSP